MMRDDEKSREREKNKGRKKWNPNISNIRKQCTSAMRIVEDFTSTAVVVLCAVACLPCCLKSYPKIQHSWRTRLYLQANPNGSPLDFYKETA